MGVMRGARSEARRGVRAVQGARETTVRPWEKCKVRAALQPRRFEPKELEGGEGGRRGGGREGSRDGGRAGGRAGGREGEGGGREGSRAGGRAGACCVWFSRDPKKAQIRVGALNFVSRRAAPRPTVPGRPGGAGAGAPGCAGRGRGVASVSLTSIVYRARGVGSTWTRAAGTLVKLTLAKLGPGRLEHWSN